MLRRVAILSVTVVVGIVHGLGVLAARNWSNRLDSRPTRTMALPVDGEKLAATVGGRSITLTDSDARLGNKLLRLRVDEYRQRRQVLEEKIASLLLEEEAGRRGTSSRRPHRVGGAGASPAGDG
jgi:hypothetical protein